jgi:peptidoglycan/xylan/chitin deacetylase (PgdA/CDA1 family)
VQALAAQRRRGEPFPVAVTLDDDLASHVEVVAPILRRRGLTATFFVGGGERRGWWHDVEHAFGTGAAGPGDMPEVEAALVSAAVNRRPGALRGVAARIEALPPGARDELHGRLVARFGSHPESALDPDGIRALIAAGAAVGFHTLGHYDLRTLDDEALARELGAGRAALEERAGSPIDALAYPHGKCDDRVAAAAAASGFRVGFETRSAAVTPASRPLRLPRFEPQAHTRGRFALLLARVLASTG